MPNQSFDPKETFWLGCLFSVIGVFLIVKRPNVLFGLDPERANRLLRTWGMTKPETLPLVQGIGFIVIGLLLVLTGVSFPYVAVNR